MTQAMQTRGQFELVGSQGRVVNPQGVFSSGFVRIPVLARNRSGEWADVVVDVELLDANGQALVDRAATNGGEPLRSPYTILPGGTMCYRYLRDVERLNGDYASHRLTLSQAYAADPVIRVQMSLRRSGLYCAGPDPNPELRRHAVRETLLAVPDPLRGAGPSGPRCGDPLRLLLCGVGRGQRLQGPFRRLLVTPILAGLGTLLLVLTGFELLGAAAERLWLRHSPAAARQACVRAALAAYRERYAAQAAGKPRRSWP